MSGPTLAQKVSNIKHMPVLLAATSATKDATDGYMVKDIIKMSYESYQTRVFLQQYLLNQLITTNNVYSKIKILRIFIVLMEDGHIEFKQNLRKTPEAFNEAAKLRPHQPKDQKLLSECGRIRDMANKVLDLLYNDVPELRKRAPAYIPSTNDGGESSSGSRISGFGNNGANGSADKQSTTGKLKSFFGATGKPTTMVYDPSYATMDPVPHNVSAHSGIVASSNRYQDHGGGVKPTGAPHERGQAGGGWNSEDQSQKTSYEPAINKNQWSSSSSSQKYAEERRQENPSSSTGKGSSDYESSGIEQEQMLVDEITAPGGVRAAPPRDSLIRFVSRCKILDTLSIVDCLRLKLTDEESQTVLRALFVIEFLLRSDVPEILSHLDIVLQDLSDLTSSPNSSIKTKANKILVQLNSVNTETATPATRSSGGQQQLTSSGDDEQAEEEEVEEEEEEEDEADAGIEVAEDSGMSSIFSGLSVSGEKSQRPSQKQVRKTPKKTTPTTTRSSKVKKVPPRIKEEKSAFGDILGLGDLSSKVDPQLTDKEQAASIPPSDVVVETAQSLEQQEADDSLLTFEEEDVEFDPLIRSDSFGGSSFSKSDSFSGSMKKPSYVASVQPSSSSAAVPSMGSPMLTSRSPLDVHPPPPAPLTSQDSLGLLDDLSSINLNSSSSSTHFPPPHSIPQRQDSLGMLFQVASSTGAVPPMMNVVIGSSTSGSGGGMAGPYHPPPPQAGIIQIVPGTSGMVGQGTQGGVTYGGGTSGIVPVMYAPQGAPPGVMYQPHIGGGHIGGGHIGGGHIGGGHIGGMARPVQRAPPSKEQTPPPDTGFSFLGKSKKSSAFDFVQDEMEATKIKK